MKRENRPMKSLSKRARVDLRILFAIVQWRYLLIPFGINTRWDVYPQPNGQEVVVFYRSAHVFGVRVARWVTGELVRPTQDAQ